MKLNNMQIYSAATTLTEVFNNTNEYIPAKANFYIQKNLQKLASAAEGIEKARLGVAQHYGIPNADGTQFEIPEENREKMMNELNELFGIEQEVEIKEISIEDLSTIKFTPVQMNSIMFMIEED